jgi:hypothetical protein
MAKKDNTFLWVAVLGVGGYLWYKHSQAQQPAPAAQNVPSSGATATNIPSLPQNTLALSLPPSNLINTNAPASGSGATSAPNINAINTTGLVPATINDNGAMVLQPGQTVALNANGNVVQASNGIPLVFPGSKSNLTLISGSDEDPGDCM